MTPPHTVKQGEHLSSIAEAYGFRSIKPIWDHPDNAKVKDLRKNPNVLLPGDVLVIPDRAFKEESRSTEKRHRFKAVGEKLVLRLVLRAPSGEPAANVPCNLEVEGVTSKKSTDGNGKLEVPIPRSAHQGLITVRDEKLALDLSIPIGIGELDPIDTPSGQLGRLNNLGYDAGPIGVPPPPPGPERDAQQLQFRSAVEEFQCDHGLQVDGVLGANTLKKLKEVHGC